MMAKNASAKKRPAGPPPPASGQWTPDGSNPSARHRLEGLEPDNFLAFMALLGLLRALETARPDWRPRAFWDVDTHPWRPVLTLATPQTQAAIAQAAAEGTKTLGGHHAFLTQFLDLKLDIPTYRTLYAAADGDGQSVLDALLSDGAVKDDGSLWPTPLCLLFGQGHQHFLNRFHDVPCGVLSSQLSKLKSPPDLGAPHYLATTLFAPWLREDPTDGFRWDPAEDRRYALRADNPSGDASTTQHGANRLAAIALAALPVAAIQRRGESRLLAAATRYEASGGIAVTWPLWTVSATLAGVKALLVHPALSAEHPDISLLPPGARGGVMRARRISVGKFFCMTSAVQIA